MSVPMISITIGFENCESLIIPHKYVKHLQMGEIVEQLSLVNGNIRKTKTIGEGSISLSEKMKNRTQTSHDSDGWERVRAYQDITSIDINYADSTETYYVIWPDDIHPTASNNPNQVNHFEHGHQWIEFL